MIHSIKYDDQISPRRLNSKKVIANLCCAKLWDGFSPVSFSLRILCLLILKLFYIFFVVLNFLFSRCNRMRYICEKLNENDCKEIPLRISWEYTAIPRNEPISKHRTSIMLFTVKGPSSPSASVQFELNLKSAIPG